MKIKLSNNFSIQEVQHSDYANEHELDNTLPAMYYKNALLLAINVLEPIREQFGAFSPLSWYRSPEVNKGVGGSQTSDHMIGAAVDICIPRVRNKDLAEWCIENLIFKQLILEKNWVHIGFEDGNNRRDILTFKNGTYINGLVD